MRGTPWSRFVEVHWREGAEAYVTPVSKDEVGIAILYDGRAADYETLLESFPTLRSRVAALERVSSCRGAGPFRQRVVRRFADRVVLVGDAAGYLDAVTGEGITLAFHTARSLVDCIAEGTPLDAYERAYRRASANYYRLTELLLWIATHPRLRRRVIAMLAANPTLFQRFLAINMGTRPLRSLGWGGLGRTLAGLIASPARRGVVDRTPTGPS